MTYIEEILNDGTSGFILIVLHLMFWAIIIFAMLLFIDLTLMSLGVEEGLRGVIKELKEKTKALINVIKSKITKENDAEKKEIFYTGILSPKGNFVECDFFDAEVLCKSIAQEYTDEYLSFEDAMQLIIKKGYIWIREVSIEFRKKKITKKQYKWIIAMRFKLNDEQKRDANRIIFLYQEKHS